MLEFTTNNEAIEPVVINLSLNKSHTFEVNEFDNNRQMNLYDASGKLVCRIKRTSFKNKEDIFNYVIVLPDEGQILLRRAYCFNDFSIYLQNGKLLLLSMAGQVNIGYEFIQYDSFCEQGSDVRQTECGQDGSFEEKFTSGHGVACTSDASLGISRYDFLNQDNVGMADNKGRIVVADGMGATKNAELAAFLAVSEILGFPGTLNAAVDHAHTSLIEFNRLVLDPIFDDDEYTASKCDTVLAAVQIENGMLETAVLGDARIYVIQNNTIIWRSKEQSVAAQEIKNQEQFKALSPADFEALVRFNANSGAVLTDLGQNFYPDCTNMPLPRDARIFMCSDGGMLPDKLLIEIISSSKTPDEACFRLKVAVEQINLTDHYLYTFSHLKKVSKIPAQQDNVTFAVVFPPKLSAC